MFRPHRAARSERGFTLIEVGVALALLAVVAFFVIPQMGIMTEARLGAQARLIGGAIEFASTQAVARRRLYRLYFDLDKGHYWLEVRNSKGKFKPLKENLLGRDTPLMDGVSFESVLVTDTLYKKGITYAEFSPDGTVERTLVYLQSDDDDHYTLIVDPYTASSEIENEAVDPKKYVDAQVKIPKLR